MSGLRSTRKPGRFALALPVGVPFPPHDPEREQTLNQLHDLPPEQRGLWTLARMQQACPALANLRTEGGVSRRLKKWAISCKWGRLHLLSPDPEFDTKRAAIAQILQEVREKPDSLSVLFGDELTYYRQPCLGRAWCAQGKQQPTAPYRGRSNTKRRIVGALDAGAGQARVHYRCASKIGTRELGCFLGQIRQALGSERRIVLIWDNWPVHKHPDVLAAAQANRIEILHTPTYAPWCNPIEKYWHKLKREVLTLHRWHDQWETLRERVEAFLREHDCPRPDLLQQVGLRSG